MEVLGKDWLKEGSEDDLSTRGLWKSHPENKNELEGEVEWEPVNSVDSAFKNVQESKNDPVCQPLGVIGTTCSEQGMQRVVSWNGKANSIDEEFGGDVEEDEEEIKTSKTEDYIDLGDAGLLLEVIHEFVLAELLIKTGDVALNAILDRHDDG